MTTEQLDQLQTLKDSMLPDKKHDLIPVDPKESQVLMKNRIIENKSTIQSSRLRINQ